MVDDRQCRVIVELGAEPGLREGHPDRGRAALAQRSRRHLDARYFTDLGVPRSPRAPLSEVLDVLEAEVVSRQVEQAVEQHRGVTARQDEPVAVGPGGVGRVVFQDPGEQCPGDRRQAQRRAGMSGFRFLDGVHRQGSQGVDRQLIDVVERHVPSPGRPRPVPRCRLPPRRGCEPLSGVGIQDRGTRHVDSFGTVFGASFNGR